MTDSMIVKREDHGKKILDLHLLYLQKLEALNAREREAFVNYFEHLSAPIFELTENLNDH